jgi:glutamate N-acetyltransferase/amino-acid N-acetyltransferase
VKTAIHGGDPNWGRLVAAPGGRRRVRLDRASVSIGDVRLFVSGVRTTNAPTTPRRLKAHHITVTVDLGAGGGHGHDVDVRFQSRST